jgi:hypothetical protein
MVKRSACRFDPVRFVERAECFENRLGLVEQLPCHREVPGGLAQCRAGHHRPRELIARADALQDAHRGLNASLCRMWIFGCEGFAHQPPRHAFEVEVAHSPARFERTFDERSCGGIVAAAKMALSEEKAVALAGIAHASGLEPGQRLTEIRHTRIDPTRLNFPVAARRFRRCGVIGQGFERQRFVAILDTSFRITLLNIGHAHAPQANYLEAAIVEGRAVFDSAAAVTQAPVPFAESIRGRAQMRDCPDSPP